MKVISKGIKVVFDWIPQWQRLERYVEKHPQRAEDLAEVRHALGGEPTGYVRVSNADRITLSVAVPVQRYRHVLGALMVSKDDTANETAMRDDRNTVNIVFAAALVITILLSFYLAGTLARPVLRLAAAAERVRRGLGRGSDEIPDFTGRGDEIGELSGVLREMTSALHERMDAIERFAADVSHEIKNPLTSLRSAVETAARVSDPNQQQKLMAIIQEDVQRLDRLITDISNASRLDSELSRAEAETVDIAGMLATLHEIYTAGDAHTKVALKISGVPPFRVAVIEDRLVQVFHNLLQNAISFSPPSGRVTLRLARRDRISKSMFAMTVREFQTENSTPCSTASIPNARKEKSSARILDWDYPSRNRSWKPMGVRFAPKIATPRTVLCAVRVSSSACRLATIDRTSSGPQAAEDENDSCDRRGDWQSVHFAARSLWRRKIGLGIAPD